MPSSLMFPMAIGPSVPFDASGTKETVPYFSGSPFVGHLALDPAQVRPLSGPQPGQSQGCDASSPGAPTPSSSA